MNERRKFVHVASAGVTFQAGSSAIDSATIMSALVYQLTGSALAVGAVPAILRFGWLFPQFFVGFLAARSGSSMRYYVIGAFGRAAAIAAIAGALYAGAAWSGVALGWTVLALWTVYAFVSGIVAVPYNDIVARAIPSERRSRLLATRFFGGGVLALAVVALADGFVAALAFPLSYAAIFALAAGLMLVSSTAFVSMGEPAAPSTRKAPNTIAEYFRGGLAVFRRDKTFRRFVFAQWCGGAVLMAAPFYVVAAEQAGLSLQHVPLLLGAQTVGALLSNFLWGWWGDFKGKRSLLLAVAGSRMVPPAMMLAIGFAPMLELSIVLFLAMFFLLGAIANGLTIAVIGFVMEVSPADARPQYSGYFNALTAPAFLLPLMAGGIVHVAGTDAVFALSVLAAFMQTYFVSRLPGRRKPDA